MGVRMKFLAVEPAVFKRHGRAGLPFVFRMGVAGQGASPGDIAMTGKVVLRPSVKAQRVPV